MNLLNIYKKGFALFFILLISYANAATLDELIAKQDGPGITTKVKALVVHYNIQDFPDNPKNYDLAIIEDDYNVQIVFEYIDGMWNERTDEILAHILNSDQKLGFGHLFGFKLNERDFQQYTSDKVNIFIEIIPSKSNQEELSKQINNFTNQKKIKPKDIINIQIQKITDKTSEITIIYKY